ncbi:hypothetical protein ACX93W_21800 [Paenibacillus sp. CAU 1782]
MRVIPKSKLWSIRLGTRFAKISAVVSLLGAVLIAISIHGYTNILPAAVAILIVGIALFSISIIRANAIINVVQTGQVARGAFKEYRNSFMIYNDRALMFLIYTYFDNRKKKEISVLSPGTKALNEATVIYNGDKSVVLEYLPGKLQLNEVTGEEHGDDKPAIGGM